MTLRLLLVANWLHDVGGVQTATRALCDALNVRGDAIVLASVLPPHAGGDPERAVRTLYPPIPVRRVLERGGVSTKWARLDLAGRAVAVTRLRRLARNADIVIAMDVFAAELAVRAVPPSKPVIAQFHNTVTALTGTRDLVRLQRIGPRLAVLVALTDTDARRFRDLGFHRVETVPNIVAPRPVPAAERERLVVGLGRYTAVKRFGLLVRAWSRLPSDLMEGWHLELHGEGPEREALANAARGNGSISIEGPTRDVDDLLSRASLLVLPSAFEGLPMVLLEAMAAGVPCIATRSSPGVIELLDGAGWLVTVDDETALVQALESAIRSETQRASASAEGLRRSTPYSPAAVVARWGMVLEKALHR